MQTTYLFFQLLGIQWYWHSQATWPTAVFFLTFQPEDPSENDYLLGTHESDVINLKVLFMARNKIKQKVSSL